MTKYIDRYYLNGTEYKIKFTEPSTIIAHYPLESNVNCTEGILGNGTTNGTVSFIDIGDKYVASMSNGGNYILLPNITLDSAQSYTISIRGKKSGASGNWGVFVDAGDGVDGIFRVQEYWNNGYPQVGYYIVNNSWNQFSSINLTDWNLYTIVLDQGTSYVYINADLKLTSSFSGTYTSTAHKIGCQYDSGFDQLPKYVSDYIIDGKAWSAQDVLNYYNQTKSLYGIA